MINFLTKLLLKRKIVLFAGFLWLILTFKALCNPLVFYDSYAYHFPFTYIIWHIGHYTPADLPAKLYPVWLGFPKLAETLQGAGWFMLRRPSGITLPHLILFAFYLQLLRDYLRLPLAMTVLAVFACPMLMIHYVGSYIDLFCGLNLAIAFFCLTHALWRLSSSQSGGRHYDYFYAAIALVVASNSKFLAYFPALLLIGIFLFKALISGRINYTLKIRIFLLSLIVTTSCSIVPIINLIYFHNPFYPIAVEMGDRLIFPGPNPPFPPEPVYPIAIFNYTPVRFFLSASELDWALRGLPTRYSPDSGFGDMPEFGNPARTGGWGGLYFLLCVVILGAALFRLKKMRGTFLCACLMNFYLFGILCIYLPHSIELRYFLYIPLIMIPLALKLCMEDRTMLRCAKVILVIFIVFNIPHYDYDVYHIGMERHHVAAGFGESTDY